VGSTAEASLAGEIEAAMRNPPVNLAGKTTVRDLMALLSRSSFLVTNDSGPMHIGAALGVPLVAIFGPTDWRRTSPWTSLARIVRVEIDCSPCRSRACDRGHECMLGVTPEMVIDASGNCCRWGRAPVPDVRRILIVSSRDGDVLHAPRCRIFAGGAVGEIHWAVDTRFAALLEEPGIAR
jgi:heptosyltransferase-2